MTWHAPRNSRKYLFRPAQHKQRYTVRPLWLVGESRFDWRQTKLSLTRGAADEPSSVPLPLIKTADSPLYSIGMRNLTQIVALPHLSLLLFIFASSSTNMGEFFAHNYTIRIVKLQLGQVCLLPFCIRPNSKPNHHHLKSAFRIQILLMCCCTRFSISMYVRVHMCTVVVVAGVLRAICLALFQQLKHTYSTLNNC